MPAGQITSSTWFQFGSGDGLSSGTAFTPQPLSISSLPALAAGSNTIGTVNLGTIAGAATAANQSTANGLFTSIDGKLPPLGQAIAAASIPVVLPAAQLSTLTPLSTVGVSSLPSLPAGTNAIGSITNTSFAATQSGTWNISTLATITNTVPVGVPRAATVAIASQQTNATGATYNTLSSAACYAIEFFNNTGTVIEYRRGGAGATIPIFDKSSKLVTGIANANEISIRRADTSNTQVTIVYEVYS